MSLTLPGLTGNKGLNGDADHEQDEKNPQRVTPAEQHSSHTPAGGCTTHTHTHTIRYSFIYTYIYTYIVYTRLPIKLE